VNNDHSPIYLLAGGRGKKILQTFSIVKEILQYTGKEKPDIAYIGVASLNDNWLFFFIISTLIKTKCRCRVIRIKIAAGDADLDKARKSIKEADVVFFSGGDVEAGMQILQEKNMIGFFQDLTREGKIFLGISAGSILMAREWVRWRDPDDDTSVELFPCLGLAPVICDTHAERDNWVELKTALKLEKPGMTGYGITSGSCLKVEVNGRLEAKHGNISRYVMVNGKIEQQPDLVPVER
jgi:peptidase E